MDEDLPDDLAHPHDPERASLIANVVVGAILGSLCVALLVYVLVT